jgi:hypothetical protein
MKRQSVALFLTTLALAGSTVACGKSQEGGEQEMHQNQSQPAKPMPADQKGDEGGEGGEGGEG